MASGKEIVPAKSSKAKAKKAHYQCRCVECEMGKQAALAKMNQVIAERGLAMMHITDASPRFAHSVGLTETFGCPEIIIVGNFMPALIDTAGANVIALARANPAALRDAPDTPECEITGLMFRAGATGSAIDTVAGYCPVDQSVVAGGSAQFYMSVAVNRYGIDGFKVRQIVIPDTNFRLPWHTGYDAGWDLESGQVLLSELASLP